MSITRRRASPGTLAPTPRPARIYRLPAPRAARLTRADVMEAASGDLRAAVDVAGSIAAVAVRIGLACPDALHSLSSGRSVPALPVLFALSRVASGLPGGGHLARLAAASGLVPVEAIRPIAAALAALAA